MLLLPLLLVLAVTSATHPVPIVRLTYQPSGAHEHAILSGVPIARILADAGFKTDRSATKIPTSWSAS